MDTLISYDEARSLLTKPPRFDPRPNFENLRALRQHFVRALKKLVCPQSAVMGWSGLVMPTALYALVEPNAFTIPVDPGATPAYPRHRNLPRAEQSVIDETFKRNKNYYLGYINIYRACYDTLDELIDDAFKVSPLAGQRGWNSIMSIYDIFEQIVSTYGRPSPSVIFKNDAAFRALYDPNSPPEILFKRIEDCQEVAILGNVAYTDAQIMANAIHLLQVSGAYTQDMVEWERKLAANKT